MGPIRELGAAALARCEQSVGTGFHNWPKNKSLGLNCRWLLISPPSLPPSTAGWLPLPSAPSPSFPPSTAGWLPVPSAPSPCRTSARR